MPANITKTANLKTDHRAVVEDAQVIVRPSASHALTLKQRLAQYDVQRHDGEVMTETLTEWLNNARLRAC